ncbi:MAG: hypothetical protein ACM3UZ_12740 [Acidobacteriota bacterium]
MIWFIIIPFIIIILVNAIILSLKSTSVYRIYIPSITAFTMFMGVWAAMFPLHDYFTIKMNDGDLGFLLLLPALAILMSFWLFLFNRREMRDTYYYSLSAISAFWKGLLRSIAFFLGSFFASLICFLIFGFIIDSIQKVI